MSYYRVVAYHLHKIERECITWYREFDEAMDKKEKEEKKSEWRDYEIIVEFDGERVDK